MKLAISYSHLEVSVDAIRNLDRDFAIFEETTRLASSEGGPRSVTFDLSTGDRAYVDLHQQYPCLELVSDDDSSGPRREGWRIWRPPLEIFDAEDLRWLEERDLVHCDRGVPVAARFDHKQGWCEPDDADLQHLCSVLTEVANRVASRAERAA